LPTGKKKTTTARTTTAAETKPALPEPVEPKKEASGKESAAGEKPPAITSAAAAPGHKESETDQSTHAELEVPVQKTPGLPGDGSGKKPEAATQGVPVAREAAVPGGQSPPAAGEDAPVSPAAGGPINAPIQAAPGSPADGGGEKPDVEKQGGLQVQETPVPSDQPAPAAEGDDDFSIFDSQADLEEIFSAMATTALQSVSTEVAKRIQKQLDERSAAEEAHFVTEEEFVSHAKASLSKTWYHCLYFLTYKSEAGIASKKVMYDALKEPLSKSPVDMLPEHMFNFGLSTLIKVQLYEKPVVSFKRGGEFRLEVKRKKMQDLLQQVGPPMSKRPVVTMKQEKKFISDFFSNDKLF
jgi:hypothetical protein